MGQQLGSLGASPNPFLETNKSVGETTDQPKTPKTSIIELIKPGCLKTNRKKSKKTIRRFQLHSQEKTICKVRRLTLEECLLQSPMLNQELIDGDTHMTRTSSRVYPSTTKTRLHITPCPNYSSKPLKTFPRLGMAMVKEDEDAHITYLLSSASSCPATPRRSQNGKARKRVTFREPEEADIKIFYSPEQEFTPKQQLI